MPALPRLDYVPQLDGVRALAVALVVASHVWPIRFHTGAIGVDVFFALSGFLITTLLLDEYGTHRRVNLRHFYVRRALRLFPALYACVAVTVAVTLVFWTQLEIPHFVRCLKSAAKVVTPC